MSGDLFCARICSDGKRVQSVKEHSIHVAEMAEQILSGSGLSNTGYFVGIIHDMGKCCEDFTKYLKRAVAGERVKSPGHTPAAVKYILDNFHDVDAPVEDRTASEILAYVVGAHHGLFDIYKGGLNSLQRRRVDMNNDKKQYDSVCANYFATVNDEESLKECYKKAASEIKAFVEKIKVYVENNNPREGDDCQKRECFQKRESQFYISLLIKYILSVLVDADRMDAAGFGTGIRLSKTDFTNIWPAAMSNLQTHLNGLHGDGEIFRIRHDISERIADKSDLPAGIYRLNLPTGSGKTLASLRFAIGSCILRGHERIVECIPMLSILEQNSNDIKTAVGNKNWVLECHSNVVRKRGFSYDAENSELKDEEYIYEAWDSPIVITTIVQMFNSIYYVDLGDLRRFHAMANSVLIIDEVQSIPKHLITLFNLAMNFLSAFLNTTVILCSATPPRYENAEHRMNIVPEDLLTLSDEEAAIFKRCRFCDIGEKKLDEICEFVRAKISGDFDSMLVVCNTKREAHDVYMQLSGDKSIACYHLSGSMCPAHRHKIFALMKKAVERTKNGGEKVVCVSTTIIEAGVNVSFQAAVRFYSGLDSIIQTAGRCNRNLEYDAEHCVVYTVKHNGGETIKGEQERKISIFTNILGSLHYPSDNFLTSKFIDSYFVQYISIDSKCMDGIVVAKKTTHYDMLSGKTEQHEDKTNNYELAQLFKTSGSNFYVIGDDTLQVITGYGNGANIIEQLKNTSILKYKKVNTLLGKAKPYMVSIYRSQAETLEKSGVIESVLDGRVYVASREFYSADLGLKND